MEPLTKKARIESIATGDKRKKVGAVMESLVLDDAKVHRIMTVMEEQINFANSPREEDRKRSDMFWECTYVQGLLKGDEEGDYLGLDLGSTNFRVVRVTFKMGEAKTTTKYYNLPQELLSGPADGAFDHIADSIEKFIKEENMTSDKAIALGFTFSFPSVQKSLKHSVLITWTKSFKCTTGPGEDPVTMLEATIKRRGGLCIPVDVVARISDTTGTLMAGNYLDRNCRIGLIIGSGSNACFVEQAKNFNKLEAAEKTSDQILVNCEWGAFGDNGCLNFFKTEFDKELDLNSNHVNSYTFEKLFGGFYLGELVRLVLVKLTREGLLFKGQESPKLMCKGSWPTSYVTEVESDCPGEMSHTRGVLQKLDLAAEADDIAIVQEACALVSQRGAYIVSAACAVLLNHIDLLEVTIGIDGSVYEHHPRFHGYMMELFEKLVPKTKVKIILVKDGSGQGGAFVAAVGSRS
ncbi:hexokinase-2-like [Mizuhopecten yessoensis]|uniref:hexokinase-2-like n=1 Tax=Mizuhopecten yessoensis TaxID=6573 RepID=UPI000B45DD98|nr:hexokinase-2-like [Mizuhopecten yessoensis]